MCADWQHHKSLPIFFTFMHNGFFANIEPFVPSFTLSSLVFLVIANMLGAGLFTTSGLALAELSSPLMVLLAWFIAGCIALCGALSYGILAKEVSESGGEYIF